MKAHSSVEQDFRIWWLLAQTRHLMHQARENELNQYGITAIQAAILLIIDNIDGKATTPEIARRFLRKPHTIGALLKRMEKQGLITKTKDINNHNRLERKSIREIMSCLSKEERNQLESSLDRLRDTAFAYLHMIKKTPFP